MYYVILNMLWHTLFCRDKNALHIAIFEQLNHFSLHEEIK